jgi:hypothetical protein
VLFESLLGDGSVGGLFTRSLIHAEHADAGLRLRLRVDTPRLAQLPWELMWDPGEEEFLLLSRKRPTVSLVRYLQRGRPLEPLTVKPPLEVLAVIAAPKQLPGLNVARERERMDAALQPLVDEGVVRVTWLDGNPTWHDLQQALGQRAWHVLHFIGHGGFDSRRGEGLVYLADEDAPDAAHPLTAQGLSSLLVECRSLRLVLLNACEGAREGDSQSFASIAASLSGDGIPAVVAMQYPISDTAAIAFGRAFYERVAKWEPVDAAVASARNAVRLDESTLEWATPVLHLRAQNANLFAREGRRSPTLSGHQQLDPQDRTNRRRMLGRVRATWIDGYLKDSLRGAALQALGLEDRPDAVPDRWGMLLQQPEKPDQMLSPDTSIADVFDKLDGELLILGEPGSGKTITLLELTRTLLDQAEDDETLPIPVVFNLSSWASRRLPLAEWLRDELNQRYDIPRSIGGKWVTNDQILPLLDGLDEVAAEHRPACVEAINRYSESRTGMLASLVVTSRVADYEALKVRLHLRGAVVLQALRPDQIDAYLASAGQQLVGVRLALEADSTLQEMAASPLLLSIMTLAYQGASANTLPTSGTIAERRTQLFDTYVDQMFKRRTRVAATRFPKEQTLHWLGWLASSLNNQAQTVFYLDRLQPEWLPTREQRRWYTVVDRLGSALVLPLFVGVMFAPVLGLGFALSERTPVGLIVGLAVGLVFGPFIGLLLAPICALFGGVSTLQPGRGQNHWAIVFRVLLRGLPGALVFGIIGGIVGGIVRGLALASALGLQCALVGGLAGVLAGGPSLAPRRITVVESLRFSYSAAIVGLLLFGLGATLFGPVLDRLRLLGGPPPIYSPELDLQLAIYILQHDLVRVLIPGLIGGLVFGMIGGLLGGREVQAKLTPNQGIWRSARSAILGGVVGALVFGLVHEFVFQSTWPFDNIFVQPVGMLVDMGFFGVVFGLASGGYACFSHSALRLVLWRADALPLRTISFLDYATERIFLRRVGGGYIFVHRLLQEYFAGVAA